MHSVSRAGGCHWEHSEAISDAMAVPPVLSDRQDAYPTRNPDWTPDRSPGRRVIGNLALLHRTVLPKRFYGATDVPSGSSVQEPIQGDFTPRN
jgi:hypothetical protein